MSKKSMHVITHMIDKLMDKILTLEEDAEENEAKIKQVNDKLELYDTELKRRQTLGSVENKGDPNSSSTSNKNGILRDMRCQVDQVDKYVPGSDLPKFLATLEVAYKSFVTPDNSLEKDFLKMAISRLDTTFATRILSESTPIVTFSKFKEYMNENHGSKATVYQLLDKLYDIEPGTDITGYGVRLENELNDVARSVKQKFKSKKTKDLNVDDLFELIGTQIFIRNLKQGTDITVYNSIVNSLDECWSISKAITLTKSYTDRAITEDSVGQPNAFFGRGHFKKSSNGNKSGSPKKQNTQNKSPNKPEQKSEGQDNPWRYVCHGWRNYGKCNRFSRGDCRYRHPIEFKAATDETKSPPAAHTAQTLPDFLQ